MIFNKRSRVAATLAVAVVVVLTVATVIIWPHSRLLPPAPNPVMPKPNALDCYAAAYKLPRDSDSIGDIVTGVNYKWQAAGALVSLVL